MVKKSRIMQYQTYLNTLSILWILYAFNPRFLWLLRRFSDAVDRRVWGPKNISQIRVIGSLDFCQDSGGALCGWHLLAWLVGSPFWGGRQRVVLQGFFVEYAIYLLQSNESKEWFIFSVEFPISSSGNLMIDWTWTFQRGKAQLAGQRWDTPTACEYQGHQWYQAYGKRLPSRNGFFFLNLKFWCVWTSHNQWFAKYGHHVSTWPNIPSPNSKGEEIKEIGRHIQYHIHQGHHHWCRWGPCRFLVRPPVDCGSAR